jgi:hypothetical protein
MQLFYDLLVQGNCMFLDVVQEVFLNVTSEAASSDAASGSKQGLSSGTAAPALKDQQHQQAAVVEMRTLMLGAQQHHDSAVSMASGDGPVLQLRPSQTGAPEVIVVPGAAQQQEQPQVVQAGAAAYPLVTSPTPLKGHPKQATSQPPTPHEPTMQAAAAAVARRLHGRESRRERLAHGWRCFKVMLLKRALIAQRDWKVSCCWLLKCWPCICCGGRSSAARAVQLQISSYSL